MSAPSPRIAPLSRAGPLAPSSSPVPCCPSSQQPRTVPASLDATGLIPPLCRPCPMLVTPPPNPRAEPTGATRSPAAMAMKSTPGPRWCKWRKTNSITMPSASAVRTPPSPRWLRRKGERGWSWGWWLRGEKDPGVSGSIAPGSNREQQPESSQLGSFAPASNSGNAAFASKWRN
eukprot:scaffold4174_cov122-Isochrysis_galbana.AAC.8